MSHPLSTTRAPPLHSPNTGAVQGGVEARLEPGSSPSLSFFVRQHSPRRQPSERRACDTDPKLSVLLTHCKATPVLCLQRNPGPDRPISCSALISTRRHRWRLVHRHPTPYSRLLCSSIHFHLHDDTLPGVRIWASPVASIIGRRVVSKQPWSLS